MDTDYREAAWKWFLPLAYKPGQWGYTPLTKEERAHLVACGIDYDKSGTPVTGVVVEYGGDGPDRTCPAILVEQWVCNCGEWGTDYRNVKNPLELAAVGCFDLAEIFREMTEAGDA